MQSRLRKLSSGTPKARPQTLRLTIAYDGTGYAGWQVQPARRTVQAALEAALRQVLQEPVHVWGSGRTDAGVHAEAQVAHVRTRTALPASTIQRAVNALLPEEIVVLEARRMRGRFHAQYQAQWKRYRYSIWNRSVRWPFVRRVAAFVPGPLNVAAMRREAKVLVGRHDFAAFQSSNGVRRSSTRTVRAVAVHRRGGLIEVDIEANGFLYHMVRRIAGALIQIGRGQLPRGTMAALLRGDAGRVTAPTAPAHGLCLVKVSY